MSVLPKAQAGRPAVQSAAGGARPAPPPARPSPARASAPRRPGHAWVLLVAICAIANGLVMADIVAASVCISAMPAAAPHEAIAPDALARQLGLAGWTWVATGFLIFFAALLSVGGHLAARLGPRLVLGAGLVIFASSTAAMMAAPAWLMLLAARAGQAGGAALIIPASLGLITAHIPPHRQRVAIGWW
ncbi:MFS transporter, partial [Nonomuraea sp. KM90]|uniref:MFS transporter n=1 Tax=Nonomuraea sp. KM90 TaxID=3457428 RepID=UPI003FCDF079